MAGNLAQSKAERAPIGWRFWLSWVLAAVMGTIAGQIVAWLATWTRASDLDVGWRVAGAAAWAVDGAVTGAVVGTLQWLVLRKKVPHTGLWVLASILGWAIGTAVGWTVRWDVANHVSWAHVVALGRAVYGPVYGALVGAVVGVVGGAAMGTLQWLVLRKKVPRTGLWVLASILGWGAGTAVDTLVPVLGAVAGMITGAALVWLLRQPLAPGRGIMGVIDGSPPKGVEDQEGIAWRKGFLRTIGYKL